MNTRQAQIEHYRAVRQRIMAASIYRDPPTRDLEPVAPPPPPKPAPPMVRIEVRLIYRLPIGPMRTWVQSTPRKHWRDILVEVSEEYGISIEAIQSGKRPTRIVAARQAACYRMRAESQMSLPQIGRVLGGRDHTTVLHGCKAHARRHNLPDAGIL
ncbi:MAG: hypothetical protein RLZZ403_1003 [Pseudomonadota bacterium]|jgi:hypothetical protein